MKTRILMSAVLALWLAGCGQEEPEKTSQEAKGYGAGVGETYKGMLDEAQQSVDQANERIERSERLKPEQGE